LFVFGIRHGGAKPLPRREIVARGGGALIGRRGVSGVFVEQLGRVLGDAGRLVYLGGVGALLVEERRGGELRRAEGRSVRARAEVSARGALRDADQLVAEEARVDEHHEPRQEDRERDEERGGAVHEEAEREEDGEEHDAEEHQLGAAARPQTLRRQRRGGRRLGPGRRVLVAGHVGGKPRELKPASRAETNFV